MRNKILTACLVLAVMSFGVTSVFAQPVPKAPSAVEKALKGMNIVIGLWWRYYDVNANPPSNQWVSSEYQEKQLDYRKRLLKQYNFTMSEKQIATWDQMPQITATSIMAGKPAATIFVLQPDWALALYRQNLLYPVSTSKVVNWTSTAPVEWNRSVTSAFTFKNGRNNDFYAFKEGYGESERATCVFFNRRLFKEAGLDPNLPYDLQKSGQWTWDKFLEIAIKLTRDTNNDGITDIYAMTDDFSTEILDAFVSSNGAMYVDKDKDGMLVNASNRPEFIEALRFYIKLRDAKVMKPKPAGDNTAWNWFIPEFNDGKVAMRIDEQYLTTNDLRNMKDDWGMVLPPKGPKAKNYIVFNFENVRVIPAKGYTKEQIDAIIWAYQAWVTPPENNNWKLEAYSTYRDKRAVDETLALIRDQKLWQWKYHFHVPGLNRGNIAYEIRHLDGEPAQLVESVSQIWNALIMDANGL
ncbi:MAG: extracellular solute-binding protein [Treponema sp.]|jgi:ABC-type glycerol-3-phosphate transport system substrate-binding protein|nr:extracellular solute-binding protein [Treponema sp.]